MISIKKASLLTLICNLQFDHPQLFITNGHPGNTNSVTNDGTGRATVIMVEIPAVGRNGGNGTENFPAKAL